MATTTTTTQSRSEAGSKATDADGGITETARTVADTMAGAAGELTARIPDVAQSTQGLVRDATRAVQQGSDPTLQLIGAMSIGLAVGLLAGGANRLVVLLSLIPGALIGATLLERRDESTGTNRTAGGRVQGA